MADPKKLFLLDAYALIYRAHFAFTKNPRINSKGMNTSVAFGFTNTLLEVLTKQKPTHIAVAFDTPGKTFRDEIFKEYKATRQETPEDVRAGIPIVKEIVRGFNIPILELEGYEADDIIGTLALKAAGQGFDVYMMTPDKDFGQIVRSNIWLYKPAYMGNSVDILGPKEVCEKWDIKDVSQVIDILGLQGDTSDNIPGIPGVGPKTAADLIKQFGTIEEVVKNTDKLKGKLKERVVEFGQQALLSKQLATININSPIDFREDQLKYQGPDKAVLTPIFDELEFKGIAGRAFADPTAATVTTISVRKEQQLSMFGSSETEEVVVSEKRVLDTTAVNYSKDITLLIEKLKANKEFAIEVVTDDPYHFDFKVTGFTFSTGPGEAFFVPVKTADDLRTIEAFLRDDKIRKAGHNIKAVQVALRKLGLQLNGQLFDTMLAHYLIEPEAAHNLETLSSLYLNYALGPEGSDPVQLACERADVILQIKQRLSKELEARMHSLLMRDVEMPLVSVLASMEFEGVKLDEETLKVMSEGLRKDCEKVQTDIYKLAGTEFNIGSPKQLGEILFEKMKLLDKTKKTRTGQYSTSEDVLLKLAEDHEIARKVLEYREYEKLRNTYVDALPLMVSPLDGRVHTDYQQARAATGRLSSNNPNLQNIPIRTEKGRQIRGAFIPRSKDFLFMSADYSQIELRIAAAFSKDKTMIDAFRNKRDIHTTTAAKVFKVALDKVTPDMRRKAKEVNFGILYGSTAFGLAQNLRISKTEAGEIIDAYFNEFPGIKRYMDDSINFAREKEYVETILGRRRYLRDINSRNITTRGFAERNAINAPIQGSAADIIKIAMVHIHRWLQKEKLRSRMIMQVHDELIFDLHKDEVDIVKPRVQELMKHAVNIEVPMEVEVGVGKNWLEAH
jgi:DNA polymerase-1